MSNFTKLLLTHEIFRILTCVFSILVKFDIHFLGLPCGIFFGLITDDQLHLKPLKIVKRMQYSLNYSGTRFLSYGNYCAFHKHANSKIQKAPSQLRFSLPSIIITITSNEP